MADPAPTKAARPLSPHLQIYKPQLTSGMSIFHRMTGVALAFGLPVLVLWLIAVASGPQLYPRFYPCLMSGFHTVIGQIFLFGWSFAFFYHFCCGIRHLLWDAGYFLDLKGVYSTGRIAVGVAVVLTAAMWLKAYGYLP